MATCTYPKSGKKSTAPNSGRMGRKAREQTTSDVYRARQSITAGEETRYRELGANDYGKKSHERPERSGIAVSPRRTMIGG